jgi:hypothetical protein
MHLESCPDNGAKLNKGITYKSDSFLSFSKRIKKNKSMIATMMPRELMLVTKIKLSAI